MKRATSLFSLIALVVGILGFSTAARANSTTVPTSAAPDVLAPEAGAKTVIIQLQGEIDDYNRDALFRKFKDAHDLGAKVVILDIDTWGGLVTDGLEISRFIKRQTDIHTIAFIKDKAISAGAMIAMSCDEIVVSGDASLGDCAPIIFGQQGLETMGETERAKATAPVLLDFQNSAAHNHHNILLAESMVEINHPIYWVQNAAGDKQFVNADDYAKLKTAGKWIDVPGANVPIVGTKALLTVTSDQALGYGLATQKAASADALAKARGYTVVADLTPGAGERIVEFLSGAVVRGILLLLFLNCIWVVLHAPGHGVAETIGIISLGLMLGVPYLTGYAQWWEILMIFIGLGFIAFEIMLPGHIFPGVTGGILVVLGIILTFIPSQAGGAPLGFNNLHTTWMAMQTGILVVAAAMAGTVFIWIWLNRFLPQMPLLNKLILTQTSGNATLSRPMAMHEPIHAGIWPPVGGLGQSVSELKPGGLVSFFDPAISASRTASVVSESGFLPPNTEVIVSEVAGSRIVVRRAV